MTQTRLQSLVEALINVAIGMVVSVCLSFIVYPLFGHAFSFAQNVGLTLVFTVASIVRSYAVRRYFNNRIRQAAQRLVS